MLYSNPNDDRYHPGLVVYMIDLSAYMNKVGYENRLLSETALAIINKNIESLILKHTYGSSIKDEVRLVIITYGGKDNEVEIYFNGYISEAINMAKKARSVITSYDKYGKSIDIEIVTYQYLEPTSIKGTPNLTEAYHLLYKTLLEWKKVSVSQDNPQMYPVPIIYNITSGINIGDKTKLIGYATKILGMSFFDGYPLISTIILSNEEDYDVSFLSVNRINDWLGKISSNIPETLIDFYNNEYGFNNTNVEGKLIWINPSESTYEKGFSWKFVYDKVSDYELPIINPFLR